MKKAFLFGIILFIIVFNACKKGDTLVKESDKNQIELHLTQKANIDTFKTKLEYQNLLLKVKSGEISFEEFTLSIKLLLKPFKTLIAREKSNNSGGVINPSVYDRNSSCPSNPFDFCHWTYHPSPCNLPTPQDCSPVFQAECISQCNDAYMYAGDVLSASETAAWATYQQAVTTCQWQYPGGTTMASICIYNAQTTYTSIMGSILAGYFNAYLLWEECDSNCDNL